jgi:heat shock protein HtpX
LNSIECTIACLKSSPLFIPTILVSAGFFISVIGYFATKNSLTGLRFYWLANVFALINAPVVFFSMSCDMLWFMRVYFIYAMTAIAILLLAPTVYKLYLRRVYGYARDVELEKLVGIEKVFVFNSALPKAFTLGKEVFISAGMLDILDGDELKAVLAHEKFHVVQNATPLLGRLKVLTFLPISPEKLEIMADEYAASIVGRDALERAKKKITEFYTTADLGDLDYSE